MTQEPLLIIGAGHAGSELAIQAREAGWGGPIVLIGEEPVGPYHRPPLSKSYLAGTTSAASLALRPMAAYEKSDVTLMLGRRVEAIDRARSRVWLTDGSSLPYGCAAIATGGRARRMPSLGGASGAGLACNLHHVRTQADIDGMRVHFASGAKLVVIGGGYIGLEVAAVAIKAGLKVTVLEAADRVLARVTAPVVSSFYEQVHRAAGVDIRTGVQVAGLEFVAGGQRVSAVCCTDAQTFESDLVVVGIGLLPNTELAESAGLEVRDGILVDASLRSSDPRIMAAGDCTRFHSPLYGRSIRLESVPNALEQARCAAATLVGKPAPAPGVPWFWSDQYDLKLKMVGLAEGYDRLVVRGSIEQRSFTTFYLKGTRVLAVDTVNRPGEFMLAKRLVAERTPVQADRLADDDLALKNQLTTS